jgi:hypothetical protein
MILIKDFGHTGAEMGTCMTKGSGPGLQQFRRDECGDLSTAALRAFGRDDKDCVVLRDKCRENERSGLSQ